MIYPYVCRACASYFEVVKSVRQIEETESCSKCGGEGYRVISSRQGFYGASDWDKSSFCHSLGQVVKSDAHRKKIAKQRGWEEVGTECLDKVNREKEADRERIAEKSYEEAARVAYNHGFNR